MTEKLLEFIRKIMETFEFRLPKLDELNIKTSEFTKTRIPPRLLFQTFAWEHIFQMVSLEVPLGHLKSTIMTLSKSP